MSRETEILSQHSAGGVRREGPHDRPGLGLRRPQLQALLSLADGDVWAHASQPVRARHGLLPPGAAAFPVTITLQCLARGRLPQCFNDAFVPVCVQRKYRGKLDQLGQHVSSRVAVHPLLAGSSEGCKRLEKRWHPEAH